MLERLVSAQVDIENFALITHAVPAERVRPLLPAKFELQTFVSEEGRETTLVSTSCFCNRQLHWSASRYPAHDFDQNTFRVYVTYRGHWAAYFLGTFVSTRLSYVAQSALAARSQLAEFEVDIRGGLSGYPFYAARSTSKLGELSFELAATEEPSAKHPFATGEELAHFITYRLHGLAQNPLGFQTYGPIEHRRLRPWAGRLHSGRFDFWAGLGVLHPDEFDDAYSVLVEPSVRFTLYPPRPAR